MSDDPKPIDGNSEWTMPRPVFRSSEGYTPKKERAIDPDDIDTASPGFDPQNEDEIDTEIPGLAPPKISENLSDAPAATPANSNTMRAAPVKAANGGCSRTIVMIGGAAIFLALALAVLAVYLLYFYQPAETSTF